jgi:hypothetical protein
MQLMAITYGDEIGAARAEEEIDRCAGALRVDPDATSVAVCGRDGSVSLTTSRRPDATAHWSEFWGVMLATLMNDDAAEALDRQFAVRLRRALVPGTSVLLLAVPASRRPAVLEALSPLAGREIACVLPADLPRRWGVDDLP